MIRFGWNDDSFRLLQAKTPLGFRYIIFNTDLGSKSAFESVCMYLGYGSGRRRRRRRRGKEEERRKNNKKGRRQLSIIYYTFDQQLVAQSMIQCIMHDYAHEVHRDA